MPRLARARALTGDARVLNDALHELHEQAGLPSLSDMERMIGDGVASRSRIHEAFTQPRVPTWGLIELLVEQLAGKVPHGSSADIEVGRFHALWRAASRQTVDPAGRSAATAPARQPQPTLVGRGAKPPTLGRIGLNVVGLAFNRIGWIFEERATRDIGMDGFVEIVTETGQASGEMFATVIKSGQAYFAQRGIAGWIYHVKLRELRYWLAYRMPVILVLVDLDDDVAYWVLVTSEAVTAAKRGWRIEVPQTQRLDATGAEQLRGLPFARAGLDTHLIDAMFPMPLEHEASH